ncbi:MAG: mechanosensitive ion channel domain-containing protein [Dokdonella sp.]|uniref:mechanosensitive ion channel family protein n=1 Tax=Dokdonella sp. TaxID=2291710 RepID=UPI0032643F75
MAADGTSKIEKARDDAVRGWNDVLDSGNAILDFKLIHVAGLEITVGALVGAALIVLLTVLVSRVGQRALDRYGRSHASANRATLYTLSRMMHYLLLAIGGIFALSVAGIPVARFAVFAGALGVGLGFGLQAIFNNFVSGLILLFERTLQVGDFVELASGVHGTVHDIHIRATRITTNDNIDILVPNSEFVNGRVVNWTLRDVSRRLKIPFGVAYGSDKERVKKAALEAAVEVPFTLTQEGDRRPQVWLTRFGDSALEFALVVWLTAEATRRPGSVTAAYNWALESALRRHGIEIPYPQRDLHVRSWFGLSGAQGRDAAQQAGQGADDPLSAHERAALGENDAAHDVDRDIAENQRTVAPRTDADQRR